MQTDNTTSWERETAASFPKQTEDIQADVAIIGGGITGVLSAYLLSKTGKSVVLLEKDRLGSGATGATTAFITQIIDTGAGDLISMFGERNARSIWESGTVAIAEFKNIVEQEGIDCGYTSTSAYLYTHTDMQASSLASEVAGLHAIGAHARQLSDDALGFKNTGYIEVSGQAMFHPLKFLDAVAAKAVDLGARIFENTTVAELSESGAVKIATEDGHTVHADDVIVATHIPFNKPRVNRFKKAKYRSYVLELSIPQGILKEGIYWDHATPYTYFRVDHAGVADRMILGGADHRADIPFSRERNFHALRRAAGEILGSVPFRIQRSWYGPIIESVDGLPFIGAYAPHRYLATAFSGNGMTYSVIAGMVFKDLLMGREHPWAHVYAPSRHIRISTLVKKGTGYIGIFLGGIRNSLRN